MSGNLTGGNPLKIERLSAEILKLLNEENIQAKKRESASGSKSSSQVDGVIINISEEIKQIEVELPTKEKVEEIKKAIAEGKYKIDVHRISDAILKEIIGDE